MATSARSRSSGGARKEASEQRNREVVMNMITYLNAHNVAGMLTCFDDEMEWFDVPMEEPVRGKEAVGAFLEELFDVFPDLRYEPVQVVAEGDHVAVQFRMYGTHRKTYYGLPPTGRTLEIPCLSMITLRDGKILSDHCHYDNGMILRQMGIMPSLEMTFSPPGRAFLWLAVQRKWVAALAGAAVLAGVLVATFRRRQAA